MMCNRRGFFGALVGAMWLGSRAGAPPEQPDLQHQARMLNMTFEGNCLSRSEVVACVDEVNDALAKA